MNNKQTQNSYLDSIARKTLAESYKLEVEAREIEAKLRRKWYQEHEVFRALIGSIVAAALFSAWAVEYFTPILESRTVLAELHSERLTEDNNRLKNDNVILKERLKQRLHLIQKEAEQTNLTLITQLYDLRNSIKLNTYSSKVIDDKVKQITDKIKMANIAISNNQEEIKQIIMPSPLPQVNDNKNKGLLYELFCPSCLLSFSYDNFSNKKEFLSEDLAVINKKYGNEARERFLNFFNLLETARNYNSLEKLEAVNNFWNRRMGFFDDTYLFGINDYWQTPIEFLTKGAGDSEDYAIAKFFTLQALGIPNNKLRIVYVKALKLNQAHMVTAFFNSPKSIPLLLDNLIPQIKSASKRSDLLPVYSFNNEGLWLEKSRGSGKKIGSSDRLTMWKNLLSREKTSK